MGAFSGLKDAKRGFSSNPIKPGRHVVRIDECAFFDTDQKGEMWKNTLTILKSENDSHSPGEQVHTFFKTSVGRQVFQRNLKSFLASVLGVDDNEVDEQAAKTASSEDSPMHGLVTVVTVSLRNSKNTDDDGNPRQYAVYSWSEQLDEGEIVDAIGEEAVERFFPNGL